MKKGLQSVKYVLTYQVAGYFGLENWGFSHWDWDFRPLGVELEAYWDPKNNFGWENYSCIPLPAFRWWNQR